MFSLIRDFARSILIPCYKADRVRGLNVVKVSVADARVEHEVKLMDFTKWLERTDGSQRGAE